MAGESRVSRQPPARACLRRISLEIRLDRLASPGPHFLFERYALCKRVSLREDLVDVARYLQCLEVKARHGISPF